MFLRVQSNHQTTPAAMREIRTGSKHNNGRTIKAEDNQTICVEVK